MNKKILVAISFGVVVLAVIAVYFLGYASLIFKSPKQEVVLRYRVCGMDDVETVNKVNFPLKGKDQEAIKEMVRRIDDDKQGKQDPTCQTIRFIYAHSNDDIDTMKDSLSWLEESAKEGHFAEVSLLRNMYSLGGVRDLAGE